MKKCFAYIICILGIVGMFYSCGVGPEADTGGASETVAIIITDSAFYGQATIITEDNVGLVNPYVTVSLYEADYLPFFSGTINNFTNSTSSDSNGEFAFNHKGIGYYNLYAKDVVSGKSLFFDSVEVLQGEVDTIEAQFNETGGITGTIFIIDSISGDTVNADDHYVFIMGSPFLALTDLQGAFSLDTLSEGSYTIRSITAAPETSWVNMDSLINTIVNKKGKKASVQPGDTLEDINMYLMQ